MPFFQKYSAFVERYLWIPLLGVPLLMIAGKVIEIPIAQYTYEMSLSELLVVVLAGAYIPILFTPGKRPVISRVGWVLVAYLVLTALSFLWIVSLEKWLIAFRVGIFHAATFFLTVNLITSRFRARMALVSLALLAFSAMGAVVASVSTIPYVELVKLNRALIITPLGPLSYVAAILALLCPLMVGAYHLAVRKDGRLLVSVAYVATIVGLWYAAGKAAILSAFFGVLTLLFCFKNARVYFAVLTCVGTVVFLALTSLGQESYTFNRFQNVNVDSSTQFRLMELGAAARIIADHPVLGVGAGNLKIYYEQITGFYQGEANNIIVQMMGEFGVLGVMLFVVMLGELITFFYDTKKSWFERDRVPAYLFLAFLITTGLNAMFEVTIIGLFYGMLFWYAVGIFYVLNTYEKE